MPDAPEEVTEILIEDPAHPSLDPDRPAEGDPTHPQWQGHTHSWPARARKSGFKVCRDCGAENTPEAIAEGSA